MEGAEPQSDTKAQTLIGEYRDRFLNIDYTIHPVGIPGEARGKSSNLAWAAQSVCKARAQLAISSSDVIMTVMDGKHDNSSNERNVPDSPVVQPIAT